DRASVRRRYSCLLEDRPHGFLVALIKRIEASPARLVSRNFGPFQPVAASVLKEIDAGINRFIDVGHTVANGGLTGMGLGKCRSSHTASEREQDCFSHDDLFGEFPRARQG